MRCGITQLHMVANLLLVKGILVHLEVEQGNSIDIIEFEIPVIPLRCLLTNRESRIEERSVLEIRLVGVLHFNDELLAVFPFTIHVKDGFAVGIDIPHVLWIQIRNILHNLSAIKQAVEEANQQILIHCRSKNALEAEIGQQADVSFFYLFHTIFI